MLESVKTCVRCHRLDAMSGLGARRAPNRLPVWGPKLVEQPGERVAGVEVLCGPAITAQVGQELHKSGRCS